MSKTEGGPPEDLKNETPVEGERIGKAEDRFAKLRQLEEQQPTVVGKQQTELSRDEQEKREREKRERFQVLSALGTTQEAVTKEEPTPLTEEEEAEGEAQKRRRFEMLARIGARMTQTGALETKVGEVEAKTFEGKGLLRARIEVREAERQRHAFARDLEERREGAQRGIFKKRKKRRDKKESEEIPSALNTYIKYIFENGEETLVEKLPGQGGDEIIAQYEFGLDPNIKFSKEELLMTEEEAEFYKETGPLIERMEEEWEKFQQAGASLNPETTERLDEILSILSEFDILRERIFGGRARLGSNVELGKRNPWFQTREEREETKKYLQNQQSPEPTKIAETERFDLLKEKVKDDSDERRRVVFEDAEKLLGGLNQEERNPRRLLDKIDEKIKIQGISIASIRGTRPVRTLSGHEREQYSKLLDESHKLRSLRKSFKKVFPSQVQAKDRLARKLERKSRPKPPKGPKLAKKPPFGRKLKEKKSESKAKKSKKEEKAEKKSKRKQ